jgi:plasmid stabilization system protein ParE
MRNDSEDQESESLLHDFDKTAELVWPFVVDRFGVEGADSRIRRARESFEAVIAQMPRMEGFRARTLNGFLRITAQEVAVYQAIKERGGTPAEASEIQTGGQRRTYRAARAVCVGEHG